MARRREERIALSIPVRVWGTDRHGKPFIETTETVDITRLGARIKGLTSVVSAGNIIGVEHKQQKCRFRVIWVGDVGTPHEGMIGVHSVEPSKFIWGIPIPQQWAPKAAHPCVPQDGGSGRRIQPRYGCEGSIEVRKDGRTALWGALSDISLSGCYIETLTPLPVKTAVELAVNIEGIEIVARAVVRTSHTGVGMGMAFSEMSVADRSRLDDLIASFSAPQPAAANSGTETPVVEVIALARRLDAASTELKELQAALQAGPSGLDPRVLANFREATNHVRQISWVVQQWLQRSSQNQDPFAILDQLQAERVRVTAELAKQLCMDIDATEVDPSTVGLLALNDNVKQLRKRLAILFREEQEEEGKAARSSE